MGRFAEKVRLKDFRLTPYQIREDDYEFELDGTTYYTDAFVGKNKSFITIVALDELKLAKEKNRRSGKASGGADYQENLFRTAHCVKGEVAMEFVIVFAVAFVVTFATTYALIRPKGTYH